MKILLFVTLVAGASYNILSLDGGGIRGMIPATVISHMEKFAYDYGVVEKKYEMPYHQERKVVHMKDLFDMISGTSTGSIITGMLLTPKEGSTTEVKYTIADTIELYSTRGKELFKSTALSHTAAAGISLCFILVFGTLSYFLGKWIYDNHNTNRELKTFKKKIHSTRMAKELKLEGDQMVDKDGDGIPDALQDGLLSESTDSDALDDLDCCRDSAARCF